MGEGPLVSLEAVDKSFGSGEARTQVLKSVDLAVAPGELLAIRGVSGSGKTTLLNIIGGIETPDHGAVRVAGTDIAALGEAARTRYRATTVGFVFQFHNLVANLDAVENVLAGLEAVRAPGQADCEAALELLARVGLAGHERKFPAQLSGGQQQRVAIARALLKRPPLILADEPTGSLDEATGREIMALLGEIRRRHGTAVVVMTHDPELAGAADRVLEMRSGRLGSGG